MRMPGTINRGFEVNCFSLFRELLETLKESSDDVPCLIIEVLCRRLPLKACTYFSYNCFNNTLSLRAQMGLSYEYYNSLELPLESATGQAITENKVKYYPDISQESIFKNQALRVKYNLGPMLAIPLRITENPSSVEVYSEYLGVICFYLNSQKDREIMDAIVDDVSYLVSTLLIQTINNDKIRLRNEIVDFTVASKDLNSFLYRTMSLLCEKWNISVSSAYTYHEQSRTLRLGATTSLKRNIAKRSVFYRIDEEDILTEVVAKGSFHVEMIGDDSRYNGYLVEDVGVVKSIMFVPILEPRDKNFEKQRVLGVLRFINRKLKRGDIEEVVPFGWEDISLANFVSNMIGVIVYLFNRVSSINIDFERSVHGFSNSLLAVLSRLTMLQAHGRLSEKLSGDFDYAIPDSIGQLEALLWQMTKFETEAFNNVELHKVLLLGDVVGKTVGRLQAYAENMNVRIVKTMVYDKNEFDVIPPVEGHADALITVLRNLLENSIKYCRDHNECEVTIKPYLKGDSVFVDVIDNGMGVDLVDVDYIFGETYRSEKAIKRRTTDAGSGYGLSQCKEIMTILGGDVYLSNPSNPTIFTIKIPVW